MAISAKQRQKKLERKAKKRKQLLAKKNVGISLTQVATYEWLKLSARY
jgi:hypothetical protein